MSRISSTGAAVLAFAMFAVAAQAASLVQPAGWLFGEAAAFEADAPLLRLRIDAQVGKIFSPARVEVAEFFRAEAAERALLQRARIAAAQEAAVAALQFDRIVAAAQTEVLPPRGDINLFGDGLVREVDKQNGNAAPGTREAARPEGYPHLLVFHDGRRLSGQIVSLIGETITLRRPDASEPVRISLAEVRRLIFAPSINLEALNVALRPRNADIESSPKLAYATIKLPGTDWLFGEVTSSDGRTFEVKAGTNSTFRIARPQVEWLYFAPAPATTIGLLPNRVTLEPWLANAPQADVKIDGGTIEVRGAPWLARTIPSTFRMEVAFTVPADAEDDLRLWLQPHSMAPNSYTTGTVNLQFGAQIIGRTMVANGMSTERASVPADSPKGAEVSYRVFYDSQDARIAVVRNGRRVGDWSTEGAAARARIAGAISRSQPISYILFDRQKGGEETVFKFNDIRVRPWSGQLPEDNAAPQQDDLLSFSVGASLAGKLEAISASGIRIGSRVCPHDSGTFLELQTTKRGLDDADALLTFGVNGEVSAAGLEIRENAVRCRTSFAPAFEMPVAELQTIAFERRAGPPQDPADRLIFKSGDELEGALLAAEIGKPLRWRMSSGQEIEFGPNRVAGVRRAERELPAGVPETSAFEFRNGDCLSGQLIALDERHVRLAHNRLGELTINREQLWNLYPRKDYAPVGAAANPDAWLKKAISPPANRVSPFEVNQRLSDGWIFLDGKFVPRLDFANAGTTQTRAVEAPLLPDAFKRYELRFDCTCTSVVPILAVGGVNLSTQDGASLMRAQLYGGQLALYQQSRSDRGVQNFRRLPALENTAFRSTRASFRLLVDTERGTVFLWINGTKQTVMGERGKDRMPGVGEKVQIFVGGNGAAHVLSNVWIGPWNGEEPAAGVAAPTTVFVNGDVSSGEPTEFREGNFHLESEAGPLDVPAERIAAVRFQGEPSRARAAGRVRLRDGTAINVESFHWDGKELTGHGVNVGDFRVMADDVRELIFDPDEPAKPDAEPSTKPGPKPEIDPLKPAKPGILKQRIALP